MSLQPGDSVRNYQFHLADKMGVPKNHGAPTRGRKPRPSDSRTLTCLLAVECLTQSGHFDPTPDLPRGKLALHHAIWGVLWHFGGAVA